MLQNARGTRDFLPQDQIVRQHIMTTLRSVFERFGFSPLDTPALERFEVLSAKYAGGEEILKETFKLSDQGERDLGLRYDLTVPLARVVAMHPELKMPFKRYHIDKVWRDGPIQLGRYREFIQCDIDVIGSNSRSTDAELIQMIDMGFGELNLQVEIRLNSIQVLDGILAAAGIPKNERQSVILTLDKIAKIGEEGVRKELHGKDIKTEHIHKLFEMLAVKGTNHERIEHLKKHILNEEERKGLHDVELILSLLHHTQNHIVFEPSLARGLSYYTGMIVETFVVGSHITSAVCSGGRYDGLIGSMLEGNRGIPAVGVSFGVDRIFDAIKQDKIRKTVTQALIVQINVLAEAHQIAHKLRRHKVNTEVSYEKGISKGLEYANSLGIPYCVIIGERELKEGKVKLKDMESGEEYMISIEDAISKMAKKL